MRGSTEKVSLSLKVEDGKDGAMNRVPCDKGETRRETQMEPDRGALVTAAPLGVG